MFHRPWENIIDQPLEERGDVHQPPELIVEQQPAAADENVRVCHRHHLSEGEKRIVYNVYQGLVTCK